MNTYIFSLALRKAKAETEWTNCCLAVVEDKWEERLQDFATISLQASIVQGNGQETLESDFSSSNHVGGRL